MTTLPTQLKADLIYHMENPTTTSLEQMAIIIHENLHLAGWENNDISMVSDALEQLTRLERNR